MPIASPGGDDPAARDGGPDWDRCGDLLARDPEILTGLFARSKTPDLLRINNDLEYFFGSARYNERRVTGWTFASPATVVRDLVRLVGAVVTRLAAVIPGRLQPVDLVTWRTLRQQADFRHEVRRCPCASARIPPPI